MVCLYGKNASAFTDNGICVLSPSVCNVSEETGGSYELYMEHPFDDAEKYKLITEETIIRAPVPHTVIPPITLPARMKYTVATASDFYEKLPVLKNPKEKDALAAIRANPTAYAWATGRGFNAGAYCVYNGGIYQASGFTISQTPGLSGSPWRWVAALSAGSGSNPSQYTGGKKYNPGLTVGQIVRQIASYNDKFVQIKDTLGRVGYYLKDDLNEEQLEEETIPEQIIDEQLFRVYSVESEEETQILHVYARHISYDFGGNSTMDCKVEDTKPNDAIAVMQGSLMIPDNRRIACQFEDETISKDWSFKNPINALLDPDDGIVPALNARLVRNNGDFFILTNDNPREGPTLEYGVNLVGVNWRRNKEGVVTRVVPRCNTSSDDYLYLEHGGTWDSGGNWVQNDDIYVDSQIAEDFAVPKIEVLDCGFSVGEKYKPAGSSEEIERTEASCREEMLKIAQERFTKDHCDGIEITLTVEFVLLGDTEQYKQYRNLQYVNLYDRITVKTERYKATAQVRAYEFNSLTRRYNSVTVSNVGTFNRRVPGYQVVGQSITYAKLAPDVINRIRMMGASGGDSTGSGGGSSTPSSGIAVVEPNTKTTDGIVTKGDGNGDKFWATDSDGNPAWRSSSYTLPLAANGTRGGIQIGYSGSGKYYPVQLSNEKAYVYVPWANTNTWRGYQVKEYSYSYTIGANASLNITAANLGYELIDGYTPAAIQSFDTNNAYVLVSKIITYTMNSNIVRIRNVDSVSKTNTFVMRVLWIQTGQP